MMETENFGERIFFLENSQIAFSSHKSYCETSNLSGTNFLRIYFITFWGELRIPDKNAQGIL